MNLKESYRYANYLERLLDAAYAYLYNKGFTTTTTENHLRTKSNKDAHDEKVVTQKPYDVDFTPTDLVNFVVIVLKEKELLADAIAKAKSAAEMNIDNAVAINKKKQEFAKLLNSMADIKTSTTKASGSDYCFNVNNEQVKYFYEVEKVVSIDFKRTEVRNLAKKLLKETDEVSAKLDMIEINTIVDFTPKWDVNDKLEDIIEVKKEVVSA